MINCRLEQLKKEQETKLREILKTEGFKILLTVIHSMGQKEECEAIRLGLEAGDFNDKGDAANGHLARARECHAAEKILEEIASTDSHNIARLT